jgi:pimeloyl-ACP methyl ester carboxylesterase
MGDTEYGDSAAIARFADITVPALVMDGSESPDHQRNAVQALAEILPNAQRHTIQGQSHQFAAAALAPIVAEFFACQTSAP